MIKKYKKQITIFLSFFLLYFSLSLIFSYYLGTYKFWNVLFDLDTPRVFGDLTLISYNHYRATVHPLFIIFFQPLVLILNLLTKESVLSLLLIQCVLSSVSVVVFNLILNKFELKKTSRIFLTILFSLSFCQIVFTTNIETYIFAQFFLIIMWAFAIYKMDKEFSLFDYIVLVILGIGSLSITITNFVQFVIVALFLIGFNKKIKNRYLNLILIFIITIAVSVVLADIQNIIWNSAPNFFTKNISDFIHGTSEENLYIDKSLSFSKLLNVINANFSYSLGLANLIIPMSGVYLIFEPNTITSIISIICFICFVLLNLYFIFKNKFNLMKDKIYYALLFTYIFNFIFHIFYGNSIAFLYMCHYNYIIVLLVAYILSRMKVNLFNKKIIYYISLLIIFVVFARINIIMYNKLAPIYNVIDHFRYLPLLIILFCAILLVFVLFKNKFDKIVISIILVIITIFLSKNINYKKVCDSKCNEFEIYKEKFSVYEKQLKDMKNSFSVRVYSETEKPIGIYYFGMADRRKLLYKKGQLIDINTKEVIKSIEYEEELIVPNEYAVLLKDKENNIYKIIEDEEGIKFYFNDNVEIISESKKVIKLPEFDGKKYSEILKVLHQEILFNIDGDVPKPNIFGYKTAWYRDTMLATMVLEETNNIYLLEDWVKLIDNIYDNSRDKNINEADNLGELLYIIGAVGVNRDDLVKEILNEINNIKNPDGSISGMVDGSIQKYYPTVLAIYGAKKNNISLDLLPPLNDDGYAKLTWYYDNPIFSKSEQTSEYYPYINWAFYHYSNYGTLYILDEIYPLSYEGGNTNETGKVESECFISNYYCNKNLYISHMWHASEMFLMLNNY